MKVLARIISLLILTTTYLYGNLNFVIDVEEPVFKRNMLISEYPLMNKPGEPVLPFKPLRILLPQGNIITNITVDATLTRESYQDIEIRSGTRQIPVSLFDKQNSYLPNENNFIVEGLYPNTTHQDIGVHRKNGFDLLLINLYPYQYNIDESVLHHYSQFNIHIQTEFDDSYHRKQNKYLVTNNKTINSIKQLVINPELAYSYYKNYFPTQAILPAFEDPYSSIIITAKSTKFFFDDYIKRKNLAGLTTTVFTVEDIYTSYEGIDNQEKIRNFIIDAYQTYSLTDTPLEFVILGGDDVIVPVRGLYCFVEGLWSDYEDDSIPSDLYYSNLDGNWDSNDNQIYGEIDDEIDWFSEIAVGRIPAIAEKSFNNMLNKGEHYESAPSFSDDIAVMIGQKLDDVTWGSDYIEEIIDIMPQDYKYTRYYEKDGTYSPPDILRDIQNGVGFLNHLGHSNQNTVFGVNSASVNQMDNKEFGIVYSQGCFTCAFDNTTTPDSEAIGQRLVNAEGGFFAFIGNTRYGWYWPESTRGASQLFHLSFINALFGENIRQIGYAHNYSREYRVNEAIENSFQDHLWKNGFMRWAFYTQILFGDPTIYLRGPNNEFPFIVPVDISYNDILGDNDGIINPGETFNLYIEIENQEDWALAETITGRLFIDNEKITIEQDEVNFPALLPGDSGKNLEPFTISLPACIDYGELDFDLQISAITETNNIFEKEFIVSVPISLQQQHFPWKSDTSINSAPIITDLPGKDNPVLVVADISGNINFLDYKTEKVLPRINNTGSMLRSISKGDINNNGSPEFVMVNRSGYIKAYCIEGVEILYFHEDTQFLQTPVLADITGDNRLEVLTFSVDKKLYALDYTGRLIPGFPISFPFSSIVELAAGDFNNDQTYEIVVGLQNGDLYIIDNSGNTLPNFPVNVGGQISTSPIILDNNHIVTATSTGEIFVISPTGNIVSNFELSGRIVSEPIAADFNNNGSLDIVCVTTSGIVNLFDISGNMFKGFPVELNQVVTQPPLISDINGDGQLNILVATNTGEIHGFNSDGTKADLLPAPLHYAPSSPMFIADLDGDGDLEIGFGRSNGVSCIDYKIPSGEKMPWSAYRGNFRRTGNFSDNTLIINIPEISYNVYLRQNYPNPFNDKTTISLTIDEPQNVKLGIYNIQGRKVRKLIYETIPKGNTKVIWDGLDDRGNTVSSGVYFYKMELSDFKDAKKMLLLK